MRLLALHPSPLLPPLALPLAQAVSPGPVGLWCMGQRPVGGDGWVSRQGRLLLLLLLLLLFLAPPVAALLLLVLLLLDLGLSKLMVVRGGDGGSRGELLFPIPCPCFPPTSVCRLAPPLQDRLHDRLLSRLHKIALLVHAT